MGVPRKFLDIECSKCGSSANAPASMEWLDGGFVHKHCDKCGGRGYTAKDFSYIVLRTFGGIFQTKACWVLYCVNKKTDEVHALQMQRYNSSTKNGPTNPAATPKIGDPGYGAPWCLTTCTSCNKKPCDLL